MSLEAKTDMISTVAKRGGTDSERMVAEKAGLLLGLLCLPPCLKTVPSQCGPYCQPDLSQPQQILPVAHAASSPESSPGCRALSGIIQSPPSSHSTAFLPRVTMCTF